jgi:hypothetical protein
MPFLDSIIGELLFTTYPEKGEGFLTRMRSKLVSRTSIEHYWPNIPSIERVIESNLARCPRIFGTRQCNGGA